MKLTSQTFPAFQALWAKGVIQLWFAAMMIFPLVLLSQYDFGRNKSVIGSLTPSPSTLLFLIATLFLFVGLILRIYFSSQSVSVCLRSSIRQSVFAAIVLFSGVSIGRLAERVLTGSIGDSLPTEHAVLLLIAGWLIAHTAVSPLLPRGPRPSGETARPGIHY